MLWLQQSAVPSEILIKIKQRNQEAWLRYRLLKCAKIQLWPWHAAFREIQKEEEEGRKMGDFLVLSFNDICPHTNIFLGTQFGKENL